MSPTKSASPRLVTSNDPNRMALSAITRGKRRAPDRILLVGVEGVGKSTFGSEAPAPIFLAAEDGIRQLDVASFPEPQSFEDVLAAVDELTTGEHEFKTLVIDSIDWLEPLIWDSLCKRNSWDNIESPGYGKGYAAAVDEWRKLLARLDQLRAKRGMEIVLLAHALISTFQNPAGPDFSRYECSINKKAAALVKQWTDANLFATFEEFTTDPKKGKIKGVASGKRVIHTERCAAWDAKQRWGLPPTLPLSYSDYAEARDAGLTVNIEELAAECRSLADKLELQADAAARTYIETNLTNPSALSSALNRLRVLVAEAGKE